MRRNRKISYVPQLGSMDSGLACITMILNYFQIKVDIVDIGVDVHVGRDGVCIEDMKNIAEKYGFILELCRLSHEELKKNLPAILYSGNKYIIIEKIYPKNVYQIIDPEKGNYKISFEELEKQYENEFITLSPIKHIKKCLDNKMKIDITVKKIPLMWAGIIMFLTQVITLLVPNIIQRIIDDLLSETEINLFIVLGIAFFIIAFYFVLNLIRQEIILRLDISLFSEIMSNMISKIFKVEISFFESHATGEISNRFNNINQLNDLLITGLINLVVQSIMSLLCLIVMVKFSIRLALFTIVLSFFQVLIYSFLNNVCAVKTRKYAAMQSSTQRELVDLLNNLSEIKCMGLDRLTEKSILKKYEEQILCFKSRARTCNFINSFSLSISLLTPLAIYLIGSAEVSHGILTVGGLIAFVTISNYFTAPFTSIVQLLPSINTIKEVLIRYKELICFRESKNKNKTISESFNVIEVKNIYYSYNKGNNVVLKNISLNIKKGEHIAVVGRSGSGKSTLIKAIMGIFSVDSGAISINHINIDDISEEQIYNWFTIVTQNPLCLNTSIRKNIDLVGNCSEEMIWKALELAELKEDIKKMPLGLDTVIGERGQNISGGQKQRLSIARALIKNSEVIVFDEATSNLDPLTEKKIYDNLKKEQKTQIIITHRLETVQNVDKIFVLNNGELVEKGSHEELLKNRNWYYNALFN